MIRLIDKDSFQYKIIKDFAEKNHLPLQLRFDVLDIVFEIRPAARVLVRVESEAEAVCRDILDAGLFISVGKGVKWQKKSAGLTCHDWFDDNSAKDNSEQMAILYIAASESMAEQTRAADETRDDKVFAKALGYPDCCIEWVCKRRRVPELSECIELYTRDGLYDPLVWPGAMLVDAPLTPHYPCSIDCKKSQKIARARMQILKKLECKELIARIINSRDLIYSLNFDGHMSSHSPADFSPLKANLIAKPSMSATERLEFAL